MIDVDFQSPNMQHAKSVISLVESTPLLNVTEN